jgi:hypothetical protein
MIRKDYIQRYFDELAKVLAAVLHLKDKNKPEEANLQLDSFIKDYLGIEIETILLINTKSLTTTLIDSHQFTITHFKLVEELLYHKYLLNPSNQKLKNSTLEVLNYLAKTDSDYSVERAKRIEELT